MIQETRFWPEEPVLGSLEADGLDIAKTVIAGREISIKGGNALTIGHRIREALINIRDAVTSAIN